MNESNWITKTLKTYLRGYTRMSSGAPGGSQSFSPGETLSVLKHSETQDGTMLMRSPSGREYRVSVTEWEQATE